MSSRLFQEVREKRGLAYTVYSFNAAYKAIGTFGIYAGSSPENTEEVIEVILKEISKVKKGDITQEELSRAKDHIKGSTVLGMESSGSRMRWSATSEFYHGRIWTLNEVFEKIDRVTLDDLVRLSNQMITNDYLTLTLIGNLEHPKIQKDRLGKEIQI